MTLRRMHLNVGEVRKRSRLEPSERRAQLLKHAISAFAEAGIERAVHADVATRAQVSTPTVFKYFSTREALVDAVLGEVEQTFESLRALLPKDVILTSPELVRALASVLNELCEERPCLMKVALTWSVAFSPVRARYVDFENRVLDILSSIMNAQTTDRSDTRIIFAHAVLFTRMHFDNSTAETRRDYVNRMCEIYETASDSSE